MSRVFANGRIWTGTGAAAEWVVVDGGIIRAVGVGTPPDGERFDLDGRTLLPGFQDAHVHPPIGGLAMIRCELHDVDPSDYRATIAAYAAKHPDKTWVLGGGWPVSAFPGGVARKDLLDELVPDRPVLLHSSEGHGAWVNSKALELAGISADTPDPAHGRIERDADGTPNGTLQESAVDLVAGLAPPDTVEELVEGIAAAQAYLLSLGITGWQDAWVRPVDHEAYRALDLAGNLVARVVGALWWDRERGAEQLDDHLEMSTQGTGRYLPTALKLMVDGTIENGTGAVCSPYVGTDDHGLTFIGRETLEEVVPRAMAAGIQPHFHAIGDCAIGSALDAVAAGDPADAARTRPHIAHIQLMDPNDVPRFAALGVAGNAQMHWAQHDHMMVELTIPRLGEARSGWQYPFRSLLDHGARLAGGSDWSVSTPDPYVQMAVAVARSTGEAPEPFLPHEALTREEALVAFTAGSAWVNHDEDRAGTIEVGKAADFAIASDHPLTAEDLASVRTTATVVAGQVVAAT